MIRVCLYVVFAVLISLGCAWLAMNPGEVRIDFLDYQITTSFAVVAAVLILCFVLWKIISLPFAVGNAWHVHKLKQIVKDQQKLILEYLTACGESDVKKYPGLAKKIARVFEKEKELKNLMLLNITSGLAKAEILNDLASEKGTELLSLKHQIDDAVAAGNMTQAEELYNTGFAKYPKAKWIVRPYINLLALFEEWDKVQNVAKAAFKCNNISKQDYLRITSSAMLEKAILNDDEQLIISAAKLCPFNVAAIIKAALLEAKNNRPKKAMAMLTKLWEKMPSLDVYYAMNEVLAGTPDCAKIKAITQAIRHSKGTAFNDIVLADVYTKVGMWGQAQELADKYTAEYPSSAFGAKVMAAIETNKAPNSSDAKMWQERADAKSDELKPWICADCGKRYNEWHGVCANCKNFADINVFLGGE